MALTATGEKSIKEFTSVVDITAAEAIEKGDLVTADGYKADGNARRLAEFVALTNAASGTKFQAARTALIDNLSGGAGAGTPLFLSDTAGDVAETAGTQPQLVGIELSATEALFCPDYLRRVYLGIGNTKAEALTAATKTLDAEDVGKVLFCRNADIVITLPATSVGLVYTIVNDMADAGAKVSISPAAADKIMGPDIAGVDDKDLINTKATAKRGDYAKIIAEGVHGWYVIELVGTWAAEA